MGSGADPSYHLLLAKDLGFLNAADHERLGSELGEIMRMLSSLSQKLRKALAT
jgi:hypothetical protein